MTKELVKAGAPADVSRWDEPEMVRTLKDTVCKGASDSQFRMFVEICRATGLNPLLKEVYFVPGVGVMAGRDGYLRVANENPMFDGMKTVVERDAKNVPVKAVCQVWRKDRSHPIECEAYFSEYKKSSGVWNQYPSAMISKVAEVLALKRSFSINGVVSEEEIGEAVPEPTRAEKIQAAQDVAKAKLASLEITDSDMVHDAVLVDERPALPPATEKPPADKFEILKHFGDLKKEFIKLGAEARYRGVLKAQGFAKSNEIKDSAVARKVYVAMKAELKATQLEVVDREETQKLYDSLILNSGEAAVLAALGREGFESWEEVAVKDRDAMLAKLRVALA